jgi:hypothetical protein
MEYFSDDYGFESDDIDLVTEELEKALGMRAEHRFNDSFGGDISSFGKRGTLGGRLNLYHNHSGDISGSYIHQEGFPELGLILSIEQEGHYVDYEPKLRRMDKAKPILLRREKYDTVSEKDEILFDLATEHPRSKS